MILVDYDNFRLIGSHCNILKIDIKKLKASESFPIGLFLLREDDGMRTVLRLTLVIPALGLVMMGCNHSAGPGSEIPATLGANQVLLEVPGMT